MNENNFNEGSNNNTVNQSYNGSTQTNQVPNYTQQTNGYAQANQVPNNNGYTQQYTQNPTPNYTQQTNGYAQTNQVPNYNGYTQQYTQNPTPDYTQQTNGYTGSTGYTQQFVTPQPVQPEPENVQPETPSISPVQPLPDPTANAYASMYSSDSPMNNENSFSQIYTNDNSVSSSLSSYSASNTDDGKRKSKKKFKLIIIIVLLLVIIAMILYLLLQPKDGTKPSGGNAADTTNTDNTNTDNTNTDNTNTDNTNTDNTNTDNTNTDNTNTDNTNTDNNNDSNILAPAAQTNSTDFVKSVERYASITKTSLASTNSDYSKQVPISTSGNVTCSSTDGITWTGNVAPGSETCANFMEAAINKTTTPLPSAAKIIMDANGKFQSGSWLKYSEYYCSYDGTQITNCSTTKLN